MRRTPARCHGFGPGGAPLACDDLATEHPYLWCPACEARRREHITRRLEALAAREVPRG